MKIVDDGTIMGLDCIKRNIYRLYITEKSGFRIDVKNGAIYDFRKFGNFSGIHNYELTDFNLNHVMLCELFDKLKDQHDLLLKIIENSKPKLKI